MEQNVQKAEQMKYRLADAMKQCMAKMPIERITVRQIVELSGTTRQTFYRHFQDKYDLINWYFDKILAESFEHMGEGKTVCEGLVKKFEYIEQEKLFFRAAFKSDSQNCLRDHDFELITRFYTDKIEKKSGIIGASSFPSGNVLPGFSLYDNSVGAWKKEDYTEGTGKGTDGSGAGRTESSI